MKTPTLAINSKFLTKDIFSRSISDYMAAFDELVKLGLYEKGFYDAATFKLSSLKIDGIDVFKKDIGGKEPEAVYTYMAKEVISLAKEHFTDSVKMLNALEYLDGKFGIFGHSSNFGIKIKGINAVSEKLKRELTVEEAMFILTYYCNDPVNYILNSPEPRFKEKPGYTPLFDGYFQKREDTDTSPVSILPNFKVASETKVGTFKPEDNIFSKMVNYQTTLDALIYRTPDMNFNPVYQRGDVWEEADKVKLIRSLANGIDIGKVTLRCLPYGEDRTFAYEVIDGKQRLTAITEFVNDIFPYEGRYFSEFSIRERASFFAMTISVGELKYDDQNPITDTQIYETFILLNSGGKPMDPAILENVKKLKEEAEKMTGAL